MDVYNQIGTGKKKVTDQIDMIQNFATESAVYGPVALASPESLLTLQILMPHPRLTASLFVFQQDP